MILDLVNLNWFFFEEVIKKTICYRERKNSPAQFGRDRGGGSHRAPTHSPLTLRVAKAGKNQLNEKINPYLPNVIGERFSQTISSLGHAALLRRCELPL